MSYLYKVWCANRQKTISLVLNESDNMLSDVIVKSNIKGIAGSVLVMEKDGTRVDDDDVLKFCAGETFMLLQPEESWSIQNEIELNKASSASLASSLNDETFFSFSSSSRSISSPTNEISDNNIQSRNKNWNSFRILWDNLESTVIEELQNGRRSKYAINAVVNRTVSKMRNVQNFIPSKAFKIIAEKIVDKYPQTFKDIDEDGKCFGDGSHTTYLKLRDRNCYLNRPHMKRCLSRSLNIPLKKQKKVLSAKAGCSNWQPEKYVDNETEETIENKSKFLRQIIHDDSSRSDPNIQHKINSYLEATYPAQRLFLNNVHKIPSIEDIKTTWPILLQKKYMFWHYKQLMGHSIDLLKKEILKKQEKILTYGQHKKYNDIINSNIPTELKLIKIIMKHFKEDFEGLFKTYPEGTSLGDIKLPIMAPCIVIIDDTTYRMFYLYIENLLIERTYCFYEALQILMSVYYIFNMEYPKNSTCTFEFLQRYFLNIHPTDASKSRKVSTKYKVLSLFNKLRDISDKENITTHK
ncbi:LOW QUALITY PROTEIN: uncharacterized protein LOC115235398 [Formica exsecta]|uniref:LOW QUALITY PROTEIN: uncharacterized protein LOC115235398 n=1 Tax=Formica exsecta TaxID=72781 RepID=UPI001143A6BA|nr:LOW QUALITY PROTEIN: uncharacterized protein LOC115235398 [Formica exsecta]